MKNIKNYVAKKYLSSPIYKAISDGIYECEENGEKLYVTSLSFEQESVYDKNEEPLQYPLEDLLDRFNCQI